LAFDCGILRGHVRSGAVDESCSSLRFAGPFPAEYTPALIAPALQQFDAIWKPGLGFHGIMLTNLVVADRTRRDLFESNDPDRQLRLMRALDALNREYGARAIHSGYLGGAKPKSSLRANFISGRYTTSWSELRIVR